MKKNIVMVFALTLFTSSLFANVNKFSFSLAGSFAEILSNEKEIKPFVRFSFNPNRNVITYNFEQGLSLFQKDVKNINSSFGINFRILEEKSFINFYPGLKVSFLYKKDFFTVVPSASLDLSFNLFKNFSINAFANAGYSFKLQGDVNNHLYLDAGILLKYSFTTGKSESDKRAVWDNVYYQVNNRKTYVINNVKNEKINDTETEENITLTAQDLETLIETRAKEKIKEEENNLVKEDANKLIKDNNSKNIVNIESNSNFFGAINKYFYQKEKIYNIYFTIRNITDIRLKSTENIVDVKIGDPLGSWDYSVYQNIEDGEEREHIIFTPQSFNIQTDCTIFTTERTYMLKLISTSDNTYQPVVEWIYPNDSKNKIKINSYSKDNNSSFATSFDTVEVAENLIFNYMIIGSSSFKPKRVYSDKTKTYIQFPNSFSNNSTAPAVILKNLETKAEKPINIQIKGITYIIPLIIASDEAIVLRSADNEIVIIREY